MTLTSPITRREINDAVKALRKQSGPGWYVADWVIAINEGRVQLRVELHHPEGHTTFAYHPLA
jgi:hypothetical protein